jgi:hypothetical protein
MSAATIGSELISRRTSTQTGTYPLPVPLYPSQNSHEFTRDRTRSSGVRSWTVTAWSMIRQYFVILTWSSVEDRHWINMDARAVLRCKLLGNVKENWTSIIQNRPNIEETEIRKLFDDAVSIETVKGSWDRRKRSRVPRCPEPRMTVLAKTGHNSPQTDDRIN